MRKSHPNFFVGIAATAGALKSFKSLLDKLPADSGMAFIFVSNISHQADSHLALILSKHTQMKVQLVTNNMKIERNHVYCIPAESDITIENHLFRVISPSTSRNNPIDLLFISLAENFKTLAIGIVLSGYDDYGIEGCKRIKSMGGKTFAQDESAEVKSMPFGAVASGYIDFVLPLDKISVKLRRLAGSMEHQIQA